MSIRTIEVICLPCPKCDQIKPKIDQIIRGIQIENKIKIVYEFKHTSNLRDIAKFGLTPAQVPVILINGIVEFAGKIDAIALKNKIEIANRV